MPSPPPWAAWGTEQPALGRRARRLLQAELGDLRPSRPAGLHEVSVAPSRLPAPARQDLVAVVGEGHVRLDAETRLRHAGGQSYVDLLRRRTGHPSVPDAVVLPGSAAETQRVLAVCAEHRVAVVPFGGGTSVVGGVEPASDGFAAALTCDLSRLDRVRAVDPEGLTAVVDAGVRAPALEATLATYGLTLGHFPQSYERASVGGYVATRSAGQASTGYGRIDDMVLGLRLATPRGEWVLPAHPSSAAGPDLRRLVVGSEGVLGVVTEVTLRVHRAPAVRRYEGWVLPSWPAGLQAVRVLGQAGERPDVARLSDEDETKVALGLTGPAGLRRRAVDAYLRLRRSGFGVLLVVGFEGDAGDVRHRRRRAATALRAAGGVGLGTPAGRSWEHGRFTGPHLRDTLLDEGVLVETLETATDWAGLPGLHAAVRAALTEALPRDGRPPLVGCHVSHLYATGASLYFTVLAAADPADPVGQWERAKQAAGDAIVAAGATITHHHAVGTAHRPWLTAETGELGLEVLRAVKDVLDPVGVLNPGKLLPGRDAPT